MGWDICSPSLAIEYIDVLVVGRCDGVVINVG